MLLCRIWAQCTFVKTCGSSHQLQEVVHVQVFALSAVITGLHLKTVPIASYVLQPRLSAPRGRWWRCLSRF